jgi:hypothetical protein
VYLVVAGSMRRSVTGTATRDSIDYTPTEPLLVVEVDADVCFEATADGTRRNLTLPARRSIG